MLLLYTGNSNILLVWADGKEGTVMKSYLYFGIKVQWTITCFFFSSISSATEKREMNRRAWKERNYAKLGISAESDRYA